MICIFRTLALTSLLTIVNRPKAANSRRNGYKILITGHLTLDCALHFHDDAELLFYSLIMNFLLTFAFYFIVCILSGSECLCAAVISFIENNNQLKSKIKWEEKRKAAEIIIVDLHWRCICSSCWIGEATQEGKSRRNKIYNFDKRAKHSFRVSSTTGFQAIAAKAAQVYVVRSFCRFGRARMRQYVAFICK